MDLSLTSNAPAYRDSLIDFISTFRVTNQQAIRYQGRLLGERVVQFTPPRNQKQGRDAVDRDIRRIIIGLDSMVAFDQVKAVIKGDESIVRAFVDKSGVVYGVDRNLYKPDATIEEMSAFHQSQRIGRGHVTTAGTRTRDIGRWKFLTKLVVPTNLLEDYIRTVQARVGQAKGGWAKGVLKLGGNVAAWIARHTQAGSFIDGTNDSDPYVDFTNRSEWAKGGDQDRIIDNAIRARTRDIKASILRARKEASKGLFD